MRQHVINTEQALYIYYKCIFITHFAVKNYLIQVLSF